MTTDTVERHKIAPPSIENDSNLPEMRKAKFELSEVGKIHLMNMMAGLYADAPLGVLREYASNAIDAHAVVNQTAPIEVTLPTAFDPTLTIRDHGVGMSDQTFLDVYTQYGYSTKRTDLDQIGAFGTGSKSAFSVTDQFTVVSVHGGYKTHALINKDDEGVGELFILSHAETDEGSGTTVSIPVEASTIAAYASAATKLFPTWKTNSVIVDGEANVCILDAMHRFNDNYLLREEVMSLPTWGPAWRIHVIVAGMLYEVPLGGAISEPEADAGITKSKMQDLLRLIAYNGVMTFEIGLLDFTPSRDDVALTSRSIKMIQNTALQVQKDYLESINQEIANLEFNSLAKFVRMSALKKIYTAVANDKNNITPGTFPEAYSATIPVDFHEFEVLDGGATIRMTRKHVNSVEDVVSLSVSQVRGTVVSNAHFYLVEQQFSDVTSTFHRKVRTHMLALSERQGIPLSDMKVLWSDNDAVKEFLSPEVISPIEIEAVTVPRRNDGNTREIRPRVTVSYEVVKIAEQRSYYNNLVRTGTVTLQEVIDNPDDYVFTHVDFGWNGLNLCDFPQVQHKKIINLSRRQKVSSLMSRFPQMKKASTYYAEQIAQVLRNKTEAEVLALALFDRYSNRYAFEDEVQARLHDRVLADAMSIFQEQRNEFAVELEEDHPLFEKVKKLRQIMKNLGDMHHNKQIAEDIRVLTLNAFHAGNI